MRNDLVFDSFHRAPLRSPRRTEPRLVLVAAIFTTLLSAGVCAAAILARAPVGVVPLVAILCVGCPLFAGWEVPGALATMRGERSGRRALQTLRRSLDQIPEIEHPLGL